MIQHEFYYVDSFGKPLPTLDDTQHISQYNGRWHIHIEPEWEGGVVVDGEPPISLVKTSAHKWSLPHDNLYEGERLKGAIGILSASLVDTKGQITPGNTRRLAIEPANMTWAELGKVINEIGILALLTESCSQGDVHMPTEEEIGVSEIGVPLGAGRGPLRTASEVLRLYKTFKQQWKMLQQRPLTKIVRGSGHVKIGSLNMSPRTMLKHKMEPGRATVMDTTLREDVSCSENQFLVFVLDHFLSDLAKNLAITLKALLMSIGEDAVSSQLLSADAPKPNQKDFIERARQRGKNITPEYDKYQKTVKDTINKLETCAKWASVARKSNFLRNIKTPSELPPPTLRLMHSAHYGPLFRQTSSSRGEMFGGLKHITHLLECITKGRIRPAWELYEIWCVVKLYSLFVINLHLYPPHGEPGLFDRLIIQDSHMVIPSNFPFRLEGRYSGKQIRVEIWYEREFHSAKPDIFIDMEISGIKKKYVFDAKYRNYQRQGADQFFKDVCGQARDRYLDGLGVTSSFILHTDKPFDYWGEVPVNQFSEAKFSASAEAANNFVAHKIGAAYLKPNSDADHQFDKLFHLMMQYHGPLRDVCLRCGYHLSHSQDMEPDWLPDYISKSQLAQRVLTSGESCGHGTGLVCICPKCNNFWVVQRCFGPNHLLMKTGKTCLHKHSAKHHGRWMYICPVCGSDPGPEEFE